MRTNAALVLLLLTGCSTAPIAGLMDRCAPGRLRPEKVPPYGGVCNPHQGSCPSCAPAVQPYPMAPASVPPPPPGFSAPVPRPATPAPMPPPPGFSAPPAPAVPMSGATNVDDPAAAPVIPASQNTPSPPASPMSALPEPESAPVAQIMLDTTEREEVFSFWVSFFQ